MDREQASQLCFRSGLDPDPNGSADQDPDWGSGYRSRQANNIAPLKKERKLKKLHFEEFSVGLKASPGAWLSFEGVPLGRHIWRFVFKKPWPASGLDSDPATTWIRFQLNGWVQIWIQWIRIRNTAQGNERWWSDYSGALYYFCISSSKMDKVVKLYVYYRYSNNETHKSFSYERKE